MLETALTLPGARLSASTERTWVCAATAVDLLERLASVQASATFRDAKNATPRECALPTAIGRYAVWRWSTTECGARCATMVSPTRVPGQFAKFLATPSTSSSRCVAPTVVSALAGLTTRGKVPSGSMTSYARATSERSADVGTRAGETTGAATSKTWVSAALERRVTWIPCMPNRPQ